MVNLGYEKDFIKKVISDYDAGISCEQLIQKYNVSKSSVSRWIDAYSKNPPKRKRNKKGKKKVGAPPGSKNAAGHGAPKGNKNNLVHGGYSQIYWDMISDEEKELIETMPKDEETLLIEQIRMYSIRERRLLKIIEDLKNKKGGQVLSSVFRSENKRTFKTKEDEELYNEIQSQKVSDGEKLPGEIYQLNTSTESVGNRIERLESELTRIQNAKTKAIATLSKISIEKERLALIREKDDIEVEDTDETDGVIYG